MTWEKRYPVWFRSVRMNRDQVIDFYEWMLEERGWERGIFMNGWREGHYRAGIEQWRNQSPTETCVFTLHFRNEREAVTFRLRFSEAEFGPQESAIRNPA